MLFGFNGVKGDDFKAQIEQGASDQEMVEWLNQVVAGPRNVRRVNGSQSLGYSDLSILGLDRWKNIFSFADINSLPQAAMADAVAEVNQHTDG
jgi:hypothetical protein